jgi:hypothetical protein
VAGSFRYLALVELAFLDDGHQLVRMLQHGDVGQRVARWVADMVRPRSDVPAESKRYGLGFWLGQHSDTVILEGFDAGVSFRSVHDPRSALTCTVMSNSSYGAWPMTQRLDEFLAG